VLTNIVGGIGLFLIGMVLLTDGLKAAAGDGLRGALVRFTGGPIRSLLAGAGVTALVQSSSATTLTTIGFVSAGLLTFPQAVGVIFGANLGTTSTGWIVAGLGLKMSVLPAALPLVGAGALLRLLGRGRAAQAGLALAGFGLIFVGIDTLQAGMARLAHRLTPASFPGVTLSGRALLIVLGAAMTVVMQSSSAAVATTLTALSTGAIDLSQGGALVIGQNVGTTVTAGIAAIGASVPARRTALAHVLFNLLTGVVAFALLPGFVHIAAWLVARWGESNEALTLAAFQTSFNLLGVAMLLPVTGRFARLVTRLVPDRGPELTRYLDRSVTRVAAVAVETAHRTLREILAGVVPVADPRREPPNAARLSTLESALDDVRQFLAAVRSEPESADVHARHVSAIHALDHLEQLLALARPSPSRTAAGTDPELAGQREEAARIVASATAWLAGQMPDPATDSGSAAERVRLQARRDRARVIQEAAAGRVASDAALRRLDGMRWLEANAHHLHRVLHHLARAASPATAPEGPATPDPAPA
jgi:phosphate:Na+ symporter